MLVIGELKQDLPTPPDYLSPEERTQQVLQINFDPTHSEAVLAPTSYSEYSGPNGPNILE